MNMMARTGESCAPTPFQLGIQNRPECELIGSINEDSREMEWTVHAPGRSVDSLILKLLIAFQEIYFISE